MKLLTFELKKVFFSKKFIYLLLLIIIGISALFLRNITFQEYIEKEELREIESQITTAQGKSRIHGFEIEQDPENEKAELLKDITTSMLISLYDLRAANPGDDWRAKLTLQNQALLDTVNYKEAGGDHPFSFKEIEHRLAMNEKLLADDIKPEHPMYSLALPNFMKHIVDLYITLGAIIILVLLIGEILSGEYENHSINLLFTQPLKKTQIIMSKFWSSVIVYLFTTGVILGAITLIGFIFGEKGAFNYPILIEKNNQIAFITISDFLTEGLLVLTVTIVMVIALYLLFSLLFKHTLLTLFVLLGVLVGGYVVTSFITWPAFAWINPFQYLLPEKTILVQNGSEWYQGIPVILLLTIVFYIMASLKIKTSKID